VHSTQYRPLRQAFDDPSIDAAPSPAYDGAMHQSIEVTESLTPPSIGIDAIRAPIQADFEAVNALILKEINSSVPLVRTIAKHLIQSGGKRIRPMIILLVATALDYSGDTEHHELACIIEFIHTATLLHDDVIDESKQRRGTSTANALWNNSIAVLVGDFLYSRAFQILARRSNIPIMRVLANATNRLSEAEVLQMTLAHNPDITEQNYYDVIDGKTAQLFSAAAQIGAIIATDDLEKQKALRDFGQHFGLAFQIIDDVLDYSADQNALGKNLGDDLAEGKTTLPLIMALQNGNAHQKVTIRDAIKNGSATNFNEIVTVLKQTHAFTQSWNIANDFIEKAKQNLEILENSAAKTALIQLTDFVTTRKS